MLYKNYLKSYNVNTKKKGSYNTISYILLNYVANFIIAVFEFKLNQTYNLHKFNNLFNLISFYFFYQKKFLYLWNIFLYSHFIS